MISLAILVEHFLGSVQFHINLSFPLPFIAFCQQNARSVMSGLFALLLQLISTSRGGYPLDVIRDRRLVFWRSMFSCVGPSTEDFAALSFASTRQSLICESSSSPLAQADGICSSTSGGLSLDLRFWEHSWYRSQTQSPEIISSFSSVQSRIGWCCVRGCTFVIPVGATCRLTLRLGQNLSLPAPVIYTRLLLVSSSASSILSSDFCSLVVWCSQRTLFIDNLVIYCLNSSSTIGWYRRKSLSVSLPSSVGRSGCFSGSGGRASEDSASRVVGARRRWQCFEAFAQTCHRR